MLRLLICSILSFSVLAKYNATLFKVNPAVTDLDVSKYLGSWYQVYGNAFSTYTFSKNCYCSTALYGDNGDGTISVHNYCAKGSPSGEANTIDGYAYTPDSSESGELMVHFDTTPLDAPYWVVELGPVVDGKYDYSIVSDSVSAFLFILTRDYERFAAEYEDDVLKSVEKMGFTGFKAPIVSYQGSDCVYESTKRVKHINMMKDVLAMGYKV